MLKKLPLIAALAVCLLSMPALAQEDLASAEGKSAQLPVPRFVTLGTDEINIRTGPGLRYPIRLVIKKDGLPVEIVREFDVWREIRDIDGDEGWVHKSMLSGKRAVVVKGSIRPLFKKPDENRKPVAKLEPGVIAALKICRQDWCEVSVAGYAGWLKRADVWGVYPDEKFGGK
jgi:SH3-like domain-containing protein